MTALSSTARPFADTVLAYAQAGWTCILPVPPETKTPPPVGFTGADGRDTEPMDLVGWAGTHPGASIALRMPADVIGIDVDQYAKKGVQKHGADSLAAAVAAWGELPATWSSTARGDGPSRIRFYRVPAQRYATKLAGGDVEIIQRHHRYAVVWPSPHADAGDIYRWYDPAGQVCDAPPKPNELPELPQTWVDGLAEGAAAAGPSAAGRDAGESMLRALLADERPSCAEISSALMQAHTELQTADAGSRHDTVTGRVHQLVQLAAAGHTGVAAALNMLGEKWAELTAGEDRGEEFDRMLLTSARKAVTAVGAGPVRNDPCLIIGSIPVPAPSPGGLPGEIPADPIAPPQTWNVREAIGAHLFDPPFGLDQTLAQSVLERTYPVMRYAYDSHGWLRRGPEYWEDLSDLSEWSISELASLMPRGNPDAEKGSEDRDRADRRKRFMSSAPSSGIAKKMRALLAAGTHPCSVAVAELDREAWLLWAGGVPWDLRASHTVPIAAQLDPSTPHLRAAAVTPEPRPTPLWDAFTAAVWPDPELRAWALRVLSVAVTGDPAKVLPILVGEGDRGKTQVVVLLMSVLGSYAHAADPRLLQAADRAHASIVTALKGRRLSFIDEAPRDSAASQERLKQLTGGGELTGNDMGRNPITFSPTHTLVLTANEPPLLTDPAVRRRVRLIPCEGAPAQVIAARAAIGHPGGAAWRSEAPGVLAAMMREAAAWLADERSARTEAAPEAYRHRAEIIAAEQNIVASWTDSVCEQFDHGTRSDELRKYFVGWARDAGIRDGQLPTVTKFGRELTALGYPPIKREDGNYRALRIRITPPWPTTGGFVPENGGLSENPPGAKTPANTEVSAPSLEGLEGLDSSVLLTHTHAHTRAHAHRGDGTTLQPSRPSRTEPEQAASIAGQIAAKLVEAKTRGHELDRLEAESGPKPAAKSKRTKVDPAERAAAKESAKQAKLEAAIAAAAGELVDLPALVTRDGAVLAISLNDVPAVVETFGMLAELTVDVETTGYPIGHADYGLSTIQVGNDLAAFVFDAEDRTQRESAADALEHAEILHAHSATADLIPLAVAGALDLQRGWDRMHDTVIPAKLADPQSTGSDPGLKKLAETVLGAQATAPAADEARAALFKAGKWLKETKATTPRERSGWAMVDKRNTTMIRYAASDVLDTGALAKALPAVPAVILERERTAQRLTARIGHEGVRLDGEHVDAKLATHREGLAEAGGRLQSFGVRDPGSDQQVAARLIELGAPLPKTKTGRPSVAKGGLEQFRKLEGGVGELVRARLDYQHHETVIGLFLEPYAQLVHRGDGRARPTVYTLGADTGRMSCVRPNLQQMPRQGGIRQCITADPGEVIISADFASVEVRVGAALTGDPDLQQMLIDGVDLHWLVARQAYGPDASKEDRYGTKRGVFGYWYGSAIAGIAKTLAITEIEAAAIVASLDAMTPTMKRWILGLKDAVKRGLKQFPTYSGRVVHLDPRQPHKAFNYVVQGTARELLVDALMRWRDTRWANCRLMPVHDEVLAFVPEAEAEAAQAALVECMHGDLYGVDIKVEPSAPTFAWADAS